jgi:hypothetical protein
VGSKRATGVAVFHGHSRQANILQRQSKLLNHLASRKIDVSISSNGSSARAWNDRTRASTVFKLNKGILLRHSPQSRESRTLSVWHASTPSCHSDQQQASQYTARSCPDGMHHPLRGWMGHVGACLWVLPLWVSDFGSEAIFGLLSTCR